MTETDVQEQVNGTAPTPLPVPNLKALEAELNDDDEMYLDAIAGLMPRSFLEELNASLLLQTVKNLEALRWSLVGNKAANNASEVQRLTQLQVSEHKQFNAIRRAFPTTIKIAQELADQEARQAKERRATVLQNTPH